MKVEMQSYQRGIDYERARIKRILKKWFECWNVGSNISPRETTRLLKMIDNYKIERSKE
jgi:hypothetical protein